MFCEKCGNKLDDNVLFCPNCYEITISGGSGTEFEKLIYGMDYPIVLTKED